MGCASCGTGGCGSTPNGCKSNGSCKTGGCNKLNTFDWLQNMQQPGLSEHDNIYEVRFKNTRKVFFKNVNGLPLMTGDMVAVESDRGFDVGQISLGGILAQLQMKKKRLRGKDAQIRKIYRQATQEDMESLEKARSRESETLIRGRQIIKDLRLEMKLSDVEFQGDNAKAIFYYIADHRVDFRELIKRLAGEFKIRVEMRQIGLRHEAGLVGGIGPCGRELCCSTWLTEFKTVSTSAARYQNLSLNPMKISGQCGRLKCCLNYELETYLDALKDIPEVVRLQTKKGAFFHQKTDIFKRTMWFSYEKEDTWISVTVDRVKEIQTLNKKGEQPESLRENNVEAATATKELDFVDVVGHTTLKDTRKRDKGNRKGGRRNKNPQSSGRNRNKRNTPPNNNRPPRGKNKQE